MSIIEDLWHGNIRPGERSVQENSDYAKLRQEALQYQQLFLAELSQTGQAAFEQYYDTESLLMDISLTDAFIKGFRFGAKIILEVLGDYQSQLPQVS